MSIYLTGGGDQEHFKALDSYFISQLQAPANLLLVPQACEEDEYDDVLERLESVFLGKYVESIELLMEPDLISVDQLLNFDGILLEGGNTFQLINALRNSPFFNHLKHFAQAGKPIYGDSAGAIILGSDVGTAFLGEEGDEDFLNLQDYRGLDLIPPWSVHAHHEPEDKELLEQLLYDKANPIIALPEEGAVFLDGMNIISLGTVPVELITFSGTESLAPNERFSLI
jgi:dipeptidase E